MKYHAVDIHRMRRACVLLCRMDEIPDPAVNLAAESRLVTYMANGTIPDELDAEVGRRDPHRTWLR